jgi:hypothetical protein
MTALADYVHSKGMLLGLYGDRGPNTCGGRTGQQGHEYHDAAQMAGWGVDYFKEDSCNAPTDPQTAYQQYATMRDALNQTGRQFFFSLCGWEAWYAPVGAALGNSWRIGTDDYDWEHVLQDIDAEVPLWPFSGPGLGLNDPCLLLGSDMNNNLIVTEQQSRAQFTMWAILMAPLLLSQNVRNMTQMNMQTYSNREVIAVNQDVKGRQGQRFAGNDISLARTFGDDGIPVTAQPCMSNNAAGNVNGVPTSQQWQWNVTAPGFVTNTASGLCMNIDDCTSDVILYECVTSGGTCCGAECYNNEIFTVDAIDASLRSALDPSQCVTSSGSGSAVSLQACVGSTSQQWTYESTTQTIQNPQGLCLTAGSSGNRTNVWGRALADGSFALAFLNVDIMPLDILCPYATCLSSTNWDPTQVVAVRDLWAHQDLGLFTVGNGWNVTALPADGGVVMLKLTPWWNTTLPDASVYAKSDGASGPASVKGQRKMAGSTRFSGGNY